MKRYIYILICVAALALTPQRLKAQHTIGIMGGGGQSSDAIYPAVEGRSLYGLPTFGVSWRTYSATRVVGVFGIDLQYIKRGFSYSPNASSALEGETLYYYTREINTMMLPIVWQPSVYILDHRVRAFFEAAVTFSYDFSSSYENDYQRYIESKAGITDGIYSGEYEYMTARDNRFGYGLFGGGGLALLLGKFEYVARVRYYFGLSDVVRNRNKYYTNNIDGAENPFGYTPIRSSLNQLMISVGVNYHFGPEGFDSWKVKPVKVKMGREFNYKGDTGKKESSERSNRSDRGDRDGESNTNRTIRR